MEGLSEIRVQKDDVGRDERIKYSGDNDNIYGMER